MDDSEPFWPTAQTALQELAAREREQRVRQHYKGGQDVANAMLRQSISRDIATHQSKSMSFRRRR